jgi:hypothetical protein
MTDLHDRAGLLRARHADRPTREAPVDTGKRLATIRRDDSELRVSWATFDGSSFLSIRLWTRGGDGQLYPDPKRGITIRARELADFAEGVGAAIDEADAYLTSRRRGEPSPDDGFGRESR